MIRKSWSRAKLDRAQSRMARRCARVTDRRTDVGFGFVGPNSKKKKKKKILESKDELELVKLKFVGRDVDGA